MKAIEGSLADVGLADICQLLAMGRKTGCLSVTDRSDFGYVYFRDGRIIHASVLNRPDRLGELLVRNGIIGRETLAKAMEAQGKQPGRRLGRILLDLGAVSEENLREYLASQIQEAVYRLFSWDQGTFHFDPGVTPDEDEALLVSINPENLLLEGARRVDEWELIQTKIPSLDLIFRLQGNPLQGGDGAGEELTPQQRTIIPLLDGHRTVEEVVRQSGLVEFDVAKALYELIKAGQALPVGRGRRQGLENDAGSEARRHLSLGLALERAGMLDEAEGEFQKALQQNPMESDARHRLALLALSGGRFEEALEHLDALPEEEGDRYAVHRNRALALEELGRYPEALVALKRAGAHLTEEDPDRLLALGVVQLRSGDAAGAKASLQAYRDAVGEDALSGMYYAYATLAATVGGSLDHAVEVGREGLARHPGEGAILVNLAAALERKGEHEAAEALYLRATSQSEPPAQAHKALGDMADRRGDRHGARAHYERAVRIDPRLGDEVYLKLGEMAYKEDADRARAVELWRRALELNPENEVVRTNLESLTTASGP